MKKKISYNELSRRDRQILDVLIELRTGTAREVLEQLKGEMSYSTIRMFLSRLEDRGYITHSKIKRAYHYKPVPGATKELLEKLKKQTVTIMGSPLRAAAVFLEMERAAVSAKDVEYLKKLIDRLGKKEDGHE